MKSHRQSLPVQEILLSQQFPLRSSHSLALGSIFFNLLLCHANKTITHYSKTCFRQNPELFQFNGKYQKIYIYRIFWKMKCLYKLYAPSLAPKTRELLREGHRERERERVGERERYATKKLLLVLNAKE
jgi:hypothetical protein